MRDEIHPPGPIGIEWRYADGITDGRGFRHDYAAAAMEFFKMAAAPGIIAVYLTDWRFESKVRIRYEVVK